MTRGSVREYAAAVRERYGRAGRREKGQILWEFCAATGYHRKAAIRLLRRAAGGRPEAPPGAGAAGGARRYGPAVAGAARQVWEASGRLCSKRLVPFLPELVPALEAHGELALAPEVRSLLLAASAATVDRLLRPWRRRGANRRQPLGQGGTAPAAIKAQVPVRTWSEWSRCAPGALQADLVLHCGETTAGFFLATLVAVDVATGWSEFQAVWGTGAQRVSAAVHETRRRLPVPLRELHTDNGGEFLNHLLFPYCRREGIRFTRGRPYKKNDQAWVEQKNGGVVRRLVGYDRYSTKAALALLHHLYGLVRLHANFFQPVRRLVAKERVGATVRKRFDAARTPYQRLCESGTLDAAQREALGAQYRALNPVALRAEIDATLARLWATADHPPRAPASVTSPPEATGRTR